MRLKSKNPAIEVSILASGLRKLVMSQLSGRQVSALEIISRNGFDLSATRLIASLAEQLECSNSTVWNVLRSLYKLGLIECGTKEDKGRKLELTRLGEFLIGGRNG